MTTRQIKSTTSLYLLYEQQVKSLCEPEMISILKEQNESIQQSNNPTWHLISRGGDALNYYYPEGEFIPTHDWDLGLVSIPANNNIDQSMYDSLIDFIDRLGETIATRLSNLFRNHIIDPSFMGLQFTYSRKSPRLSGVFFTYRLGEQVRSNSVSDLYIWGNVSEGVIWKSPRIAHEVDVSYYNTNHFETKYDYALMQDLKNFLPDQNNLVSYLQEELNKNRETLFRNTFNYIIQDINSSMEYVAPGDLLTDTMRMIYQSLYNIKIGQGNNKLDKYIVKYSKLLDVINKMSSLCSGKGCDTITAEVITRDTNNLDCTGKPIQDRNVWGNTRKTELEQWYRGDYLSSNVWQLVPSKKLCEMVEVLM